jgi:hypothetical protein
VIVYGAKAEDLDVLRMTDGYSTNQGACQHVLEYGTCMRLRKAKTNRAPSGPGYFTTEVESYLFAAYRRDIYEVNVEDFCSTGSRLRFRHPSSKTR